MFIFTQQEHFSEKCFLLVHYTVGKEISTFVPSPTLLANEISLYIALHNFPLVVQHIKGVPVSSF